MRAARPPRRVEMVKFLTYTAGAFHFFQREDARLIANQLHLGPDLKYDFAHVALLIAGKLELPRPGK
jgi:hypothetical protein